MLPAVHPATSCLSLLFATTASRSWAVHEPPLQGRAMRWFNGDRQDDQGVTTVSCSILCILVSFRWMVGKMPSRRRTEPSSPCPFRIAPFLVGNSVFASRVRASVVCVSRTRARRRLKRTATRQQGFRSPSRRWEAVLPWLNPLRVDVSL